VAGEFESVLLRSPLVRVRLQDYLDRREQLEMQLDQDQAIIRNYSRRELDIFYTDELEGFDDPTQRAHAAAFRVATNFRQLFSTFLPSFSAVLVHSSGVIRNGRAALFLAPSTGGKTTVMRMATGDPILNDDQIVLRREGDHIVAHSTPLGSITSGPCQARLGGFFLLEQAEHFDLSPLAAQDVIQFVWNENPNYSFFLPRHLKTQAFTVLTDACYQAPAYRMCFPKDYVDWDAIDVAMAR
jgi:hypothetical protein